MCLFVLSDDHRIFLLCQSCRLYLDNLHVCWLLVDSQIAEWDEPESDFGEDVVLNLEGSEDASENKDSWTRSLLKTNLGGFLHGLTGTKVGSGDYRF